MALAPQSILDAFQRMIVAVGGTSADLKAARDWLASLPSEVVSATAARSAPVAADGAVQVDCAAGGTAVVLLTANVDTTTIVNPPAAGTVGTMMLWLVQDGTGGWSFVFPASFDWGGQDPPAIATGPGQETIVTAATRDAGASWKAGLAWSAVSP